VEYQASSPDEIALVKFAETLEMRLVERDQNLIRIKNAAGVIETYFILANFPFSSDTKRMGIIMRHEASNRLVFYLKGAETVMKNKVKPNQRVDIDESCENLANEGLRTLVISHKIITEDFYNQWQVRYEAAKADLGDRERLVRECIDELEHEMELLGVTGVEDRLQDNVAVVIESLRNAGVQVWMLTGDKVETATCIAVSAGFKRRNQPIFFMRDLTDTFEAKKQMDDFGRKATTAILMIDGQTVDLILGDKKLEDQFFSTATKAPSVCVCRCSPT
jgi:phospholipid-translocating ATPase